MTIRTQLKAKTWKDESGVEIPVSRITKNEKIKEKYSYVLAMEAAKISDRLLNFKSEMARICREVLNQHLTDKEIEKSKGNLIWYNFDGSIKIEIKVNEQIDFDSVKIELCKQKLLALVGGAIKDEASLIEELVKSAFQTSKGKLDTKKILGLRRYSSRIKDPLYAEAMELLDGAIRRPESKTYYQIWVKDEQGQYQNIDLNFASIQVPVAELEEA